MKELWCNFDGVIVCNEFHNINTANLTQEEFVKFVNEAYAKNPISSPTIKQIISEYRSKGHPVNIITGRKKSYLAKATEKILEDHGINVDNIHYYPEGNAYIMTDYYAWKEEVIGESIKAEPAKKVQVID